MIPAQGQPLRLNEFQSLMRRWSEMAPYHFIHAMRVAGPLDIDRWRQAAEETVAPLRLGAPKFDGCRSVRFTPAPPVSIETPGVDFQSHIDMEMNRPFSTGEMPLRFFAIEEAAGSHWFGVVIDHWLADDRSARHLLGRIFLCCTQRDDPGSLPPLRLGGAFSTPCFGGFFRALPALAKQIANHRRAFRLPVGDPLDFRVRTFCREAPSGLIADLLLLARRRGVTVHDLFLTECAQTFGEFYETRFHEKRRGIGLTTPMDLRRFDNGDSAENVLRLELGYFTLVVTPVPESGAAALTRDIAAKTRALKAGGRIPPGALALARIWWDLSRGRRAKSTLFQRSVPMACGISNVNLTGTWIADARPRLLDYRRIGPAGPIVPMVFMITTIGDRLSVAATYRTTVFTQGDAELLGDRFVARLSSLAL